MQTVAQGVVLQLGPEGPKCEALLARWQVAKLSEIPMEYYPQFHSELLALVPPQS